MSSDRNIFEKINLSASFLSRRQTLLGLTGLAGGAVFLSACGGGGSGGSSPQPSSGQSSSSSSSSSTSSATPSPQYLSDLSTAPAAAYATRKIVAAYAGPALQVYIGATLTDLNFNGDDLDVSALTDGSYEVQKWYDQSGNGQHLKGGTSQRPRLFVRTGHRPCVIFADNQFLDIPAAVKINRGNMAAFFAARFIWQSETPTRNFHVGDIATAVLKVGTWLDRTKPETLHLVTESATVMPSSPSLLPTCTPCLLGINSGGSGLPLRRDVATETLSALPSLTLAGGQVGNQSPTAPETTRQDVFGFVLYNTALSNAVELGAAEVLTQKLNLNSWTPTHNILVIGASTVKALGSVNNIGLTRVIHDNFGNSPNIWIRNIVSHDGVSADNGTILAVYKRYWNQTAPYLNVEPAATHNILYCWLGGNDIRWLKDTPAHVESLLDQFFNIPPGNGPGLAAQGWTGTVWSTVLPRVPLVAAFDTGRRQLNADMKTMAGITTICDGDAQTVTGGALQGFPSDSTLSYDGTHLTEKAYILLGPTVKASIDRASA